MQRFLIFVYLNDFLCLIKSSEFCYVSSRYLPNVFISKLVSHLFFQLFTILVQ